MQAAIYALHDPDTGEVRYIGKANKPNMRLKTHVRESRTRRRPVNNWVQGLVAQGKMPVLEVVHWTDYWEEAERSLIADCRAAGMNLLNLADGGATPSCTPQQRKNSGVKLQDHPNTMAARAENGRKNAKAIHSDPERKRIWKIKQALGLALKQGWLKESHKEKMRAAAARAPKTFGQWASI